MATNPRVPEQFTPPQNRSETEPTAPTSPAPGVILAIVVALLLLGAIFYFMPGAKRQAGVGPGAPGNSQPLPGDLQIGKPIMSVNSSGQSLTLDANIRNVGQDQITGAVAELTFHSANGQTAIVLGKVLGLAGRRSESTQDLAISPLQAGETRPARIVVSDIPAGWDRHVPGIRIMSVTAH